MPLFKSKDSESHRLQVLTLDYLVEGDAELSGQNLIRLFVMTDVAMRAVRGDTPPAPRGSTWAIGENFGGLIAVAPVDDAGREALESFGNAGKHELPVDVFTGHYRMRGTVLSMNDDPTVIGNLDSLWMRDVEVECLAPGATLGTWRPPCALVYLTQLQGIVSAG